MTEGLEGILRKGLGIWRRNLLLGVPFILDLVIEFIVLMVAILSLVLFSVGLFSFQSYEGMYSDFTYPDISAILTFLLLFIAGMMFVCIVCMLVNAFFEAGAIGMAKTAVDTGKTELEGMVEYGRKKGLSLFFANILLNVVLVVGVAVILGILLVISLILKGLPVLWLLLLVGVILSIVYSLLIDVIFSPVKYALVISDLGAVEGVRKGYRFFMDNKLHVFFLWLIISGIGLSIGVVNFIFGLMLMAVPVVGSLIRLVFNLVVTVTLAVTLSPIIACWWTSFYMDREGVKPDEITSETPPVPPPVSEISMQEPIYI